MGKNRYKTIQLDIVQFLKQITGSLQAGNLDQYMLPVIRQQPFFHPLVEAFIQHIFGCQMKVYMYMCTVFPKFFKPVPKVIFPVLSQISHYMRCQENTFHSLPFQKSQHGKTVFL